jgi:hypothetical protein
MHNKALHRTVSVEGLEMTAVSLSFTARPGITTAGERYPVCVAGRVTGAFHLFESLLV